MAPGALLAVLLLLLARAATGGSSSGRAAVGVSGGEVAVLTGRTLVTEHRLAHPTGSSGPPLLAAHNHQRLRLGFDLALEAEGQEAYDGSLVPEQLFARLCHEGTEQEIVFVLKAERREGAPGLHCSLDLDLAQPEVQLAFQGLSGVYALDVYIGDAGLAAPVAWHAARVDLRFEALAEDALPQATTGPQPDLEAWDTADPDHRATYALSLGLAVASFALALAMSGATE